MPCQDCEQARIAVHTARVEREHDRDVIESLKRQIKELEAKVRESEKRKK